MGSFRRGQHNTIGPNSRGQRHSRPGQISRLPSIAGHIYYSSTWTRTSRQYHSACGLQAHALTLPPNTATNTLYPPIQVRHPHSTATVTVHHYEHANGTAPSQAPATSSLPLQAPRPRTRLRALPLNPWHHTINATPSALRATMRPYRSITGSITPFDPTQIGRVGLSIGQHAPRRQLLSPPTPCRAIRPL